jgi:hypothetical protein
MVSRGSGWLDGVLAVGLGITLLAAADWLVPPATVPFDGHGERFAAMAQAPFEFTGAFPHRLLWPVLAWLAGACGVGPVAVSHALGGALLAVVAYWLRRRGLDWPGTILATAAVAASGGVLVYQAMACFSDSLNLLLLVLTVQLAARPGWFWGLVLLAAFSHELVFFLSPWLLWLRRQHGGSWRADGLRLGVVLAIYTGFRLLVGWLGSGAYDASYYVANNFWVPWGLPAMWALWGLVVLVEFGPLLVLAVALAKVGDPALGGRTGVVLYGLCLLPLMVLAYDVMRFAAFVMLPVLAGAAWLARGRAGQVLLLLLVGAAAVCYRWTHPDPAAQGGAAFTTLSGDVLALLPGRVEADRPRAWHHAWSFTVELLCRRASIWLGALLAAILVGVVGWQLPGWLAIASRDQGRGSPKPAGP